MTENGQRRQSQLILFDEAERIEQRDRRRLQWATEIMAEEPEEISYLHAGLCMAALPHRRPAREFEPWTRTNGDYRLTVTPGWLTPKKGDATPVGIPFGTKARLILLYIMGAAVRNRSPIIPMHGSMSAWMRSIGLSVTGGENGTIKHIREQTLRVSQCGFQLRHDGDEKTMIRSRQLVSGLQLWQQEKRLGWAEEIELDRDFYEHLTEHAVPLDERAIAALKKSSMGLDLYTWLSHRLPRLKRPTILRYDQLETQFGAQTTKTDKLGELIRRSITDVLAVYPDARVELVRGGLKLYPSTPSVPHRQGRLTSLRMIR